MPLKTLITGHACRLPGSPDVDALTRALFDGRDLVSEIPEDRWAHSPYYHPAPGTPGKSYTFSAGVLDDLWSFDAAAFGISPREAAQMDPQQRLLLQVVHEALEDAGLARDRLVGQPVGVFVGASTMTHGTRVAHDPMLADPYMMTGNTLSLVSNRISYVYDLRGPSLTVDTACSSAHFAFDLAEEALARGEIDTAIVAGSNILLDPQHFIGFSAAQMLSPTGRSRPFSAHADGYARAEGVVAFVLERKTPEAIAPRRARAAILGVGTNADGRTITAALPSLEGQTQLLRNVYETSGIDPETLAFVEAHGTGTAVGDPIEAGALGHALGAHRTAPLPIGSIKSNIGHLEPAAGAAGVLKSLIAFEHGRYPATLHAEEPNPNIDFDALNLSIVREPLALNETADRPLRAGVSSFGFGGANAHVILEKMPDVPAATPSAPATPPVLMVSAATEESMRDLLAEWSDKLRETAPDAAGIGELAGEALAFRALADRRAAVLCEDAAATAEILDHAARGIADQRVVLGESNRRDEPTVFVFSGNGSQYGGMGQLARATDKTYAAKLDEIDRIFAALSGWSIIEQMESPELDEELKGCGVAQPLLFADQIAQVAALAARGLKPAAVMGHSGGEVAAAHVAGALSLEEALALIYWRSFSQEALRGTGTMAALQVGIEEASESLAEFGGDIHIAADNSPRSVTLVGANETIADYIKFARRSRRWACVKLDIDYPYHSPAQDQILDELRAAIAGMTPAATTLPFVSSVTGKVEPGEALGTAYWCDNVRQPVRFRAAMETLAGEGYRAFLEIGPSPVLVNYMKGSIASDIPDAVVIAGFEKKDTIDPVGRTLARAAVHGCAVSAPGLAPKPVTFDPTLPRYPWSNQVYRVDQTATIARQFGTASDYHHLLGIEDGDEGAVWRSDLDLSVLPAMADHQVGAQVLLPATGFAEIALAAAQRALRVDDVELRDFDILAPLRLSENKLTVLRTSALATSATVQLESQPRGVDTPWRTHLRGRFYHVEALPSIDAAPDPARLPGDLDGAVVYAAGREIGLEYGPGFRRLSHLRLAGDDRAEVILHPAAPMALGHEGEIVHALDLVGADAVFHGVIGILLERQLGQHSYLPVRIGRLSLLQSGAMVASGRIHVQRVGQRSVLADFTLYDADGEPIALLHGVRFQAAQLQRGIDLAQHAYRFVPQVLTAADESPDLGLEDALALTEEPAFSADDEGIFLVEGIAQKAVLAAARTLADPSGIVADPGDDASDYFHSAMGVLLRAGLAEPVDGGWRLAPEDPDAPAPAELVGSLLARRPDLGSEAALLARLATGLDDLLLAAPDSKTAVFGREALVNFTEGSVFAARRNQLLVRLAAELADRWPEGAQLRIAEVSDGTARLLPDLINLPAFDQAVLTEVVAPCRGDEGAAVALPPERVTRVELATCSDQFDLILVPGTLDKAKDAEDLVKSLAERMAPGGRLAVTAEAASDFGDLVQGFDPDWFAGTDAEGQPISRLPLPEDLAQMVAAGGLTDPQVADLPDGFGIATLLVAGSPARAAQKPAVDPQLQALVAALVAGDDHPQVSDVPGAAMRIARPGDAAAAAATVILYGQPGADSAGSAAADITAARLLFLRDLAAELGSGPARLVAILPGGTGQPPARASDPLQVASWDALRVMTNEYPELQRLAIDLSEGLTGDTLAARVADRMARESEEAEVILSEHQSHGLRIVRGLPKRLQSGADLGAILPPPVTGGLDELQWTAFEREAPKAGEVEIEVGYTGLNYRDVMWAMGLLPEEALEKGFAGPTLGMECAGTVVRVGEGVEGLAVGDPVVAFGPASFASHRTLSTDFVARLPESIGLEAAAAIPVPFFTAHYALIHMAALSEGETVLIHGGAGGVGLAAIQIAQNAGARVIATAGSPVKRALLRAAGVTDILDSRSLSFAERVMEMTDGRGVDVVLNSLAGEAMEKSLNCIAPFGRFLELGKQDYYANTLIGLRPLKENITYFGIDVDQLIAARPVLGKRLFADMLDGFHAGKLRPIPFRSFQSGRVIDAFRLMQSSGHIGKIVVRPARQGALPAPGAGLPGFAANPEGAHMIVGGLGGLGLEVADWLIRRGARSLVLVGRRAEPNEETAARIEAWRAQGVSVRLAACDIADPDALAALLEELRAEGPIRGVIHSAMVLEDMPMTALTPESLARTLPAKITGGANLDRLTRDDALDYFVLFSSVAAMFGNHGQSAYVAANGYLEGIARDRRAAGLPGLAVGWGAVVDAGYVAREAQQAALIKRATGDVAFTARHLTDALDRLLAPGVDPDPVQYVSNMRWGALSRTLRTLGEPGYRVLRMLKAREGEDSGGDNLVEELKQLPRRKAEARLVAFLSERIANILRVSESSINTNTAIEKIGVDSLMAVELGLSLEQSFGDSVPVSLIADTLSITQIARKIVDHLQSAEGEEAGSEAAAMSVLAKHAAPGEADAVG